RDVPKLRFGPWLVDAVSSGIYQGLCWTDRDRGIFRVPWKHNSRKDVTSSDREIFKVGGMGVHQKQPPGTQGHGPRVHLPSPPGLGKGEWTWKTNFRCALRSTRMFVELDDHSSCGDDPHKVF
ncbi:IRF3 factor, partial [Probosciger aterrimus]|nr:IRF3 factor [Probosciger aterrimus]